VLLIRAIQVENVDGVCTYKVAVFINAKPIWEGLVGDHKRVPMGGRFLLAISPAPRACNPKNKSVRLKSR